MHYILFYLRSLCQKRQYSEIATLLQGVSRVMEHFTPYLEIPQVKELAGQVSFKNWLLKINLTNCDTFKQLKLIEKRLGDQITSDFKEALSGTGPKQSATLTQLSEACSVLDVIEPRFRYFLLIDPYNHVILTFPVTRREIIRWFVSMQLVEYTHLFQESEENAWLDRIDRRYAWIKRHLLSFEERMGRIFPLDWEMSERITIEFCNITRY